jgi:hypothetical protein
MRGRRTFAAPDWRCFTVRRNHRRSEAALRAVCEGVDPLFVLTRPLPCVCRISPVCGRVDSQAGQMQAPAIDTYDSPPDTPADVEQMMESPVTSASPTYSDLEEWPGDGLMEEAMGVVAEMLVTFHGVRQRDWSMSMYHFAGGVLPGLDIPWHPPFIPGYGSYMNSLGLDTEMAAELATRPVLGGWGHVGGERRYRSFNRGDLDVVNGGVIQGMEGPPLETWPCADRRLFGSLMLMGRGVRSRVQGVTRVWARVQREAERQRMREVRQELRRRQEEILARGLAQEWKDACGSFARTAA